MSPINEDTLEHAALKWFADLGYEVLYGSSISRDGDSPVRASYKDVILEGVLRDAIRSLNSTLPVAALDEVYQRASTSVSQDLVHDNQKFHRLMTTGVDVECREPNGTTRWKRARLIDFAHPTKNIFHVVNQFTVQGASGTRRADIVVFVNGMPLAVFELKSMTDPTAILRGAHNQLQTYKNDIPLLFRTNALLVISDGSEARVGSLTAPLERFMPWRTTDGVTIHLEGAFELATLIQGLFAKEILIDLVGRFIVFDDKGASVSKKIAGYHQYHAVNAATRCTLSAASLRGDKRIGIIWHTQGSGKSLTMAFYAGKIIQEARMKNPTLVVLTDRNDLDSQLFATFAACEDLLRQHPQQAKDRDHLKELLARDVGGVIFTTIQKFAPDEAERYPLLSERRNIVIISDEAHRSHYGFIKGFARHVRDGLPNASFIGFTGTPIALATKDTRAVFGETIHTYDIKQSVRDGATVRIYYESRLAQIKINEEERPRIGAEFEEITENQEAAGRDKLKRKWSQLEALVGTEKRINQIAKDIVEHFQNRLDAMDGKGLIVCMSRRICVELYNAITKIRPQWHHDDDKKGFIKVVMTGSASDEESFQPHIRNKQGRDFMARRMKDSNDPLKLAIVRDMWLTGFDVTAMHTMYIDKPMQGHGLMQAIARVNRVFKDKTGGLVVDYIGLADHLRKALAEYTQGDREEVGIEISDAIAIMQEKYENIKQLLHGFDYIPAIHGTPDEKIRILPQALNHILKQDQEQGRKKFMQFSLELFKAFALCAASDEAKRIRDEVGFFLEMRGLFAKKTSKEAEDSEDVEASIRQLVSKAVSSTAIVDIFDAAGLKSPKIGILSDEFLAEIKGMKHKHLALEMLEKLLRGEIKTRSKKNIVQARDFMQKLDETIKKYHNKMIETSQVIEELIGLAQYMRDAQNRGKALNLNDDEVAFYDALADNKSAQDILGDEQLRVIACEVANSIRKHRTIDWEVRENVRAGIRVEVKRILRKYGYPPDFQEKATQTVLEQAELLSLELAHS